MELTQKQKQKIEAIAKKYHLRLVLLFGSQAKGEAKKNSDIDMAISASKKFSESDMINLNYEFTNIFSIDRIDLVDLHGAPPLLMKQIADSAKIIYQKTLEEFPRFSIYAMRVYVEAKPLFDLRRARIDSTIKSNPN